MARRSAAISARADSTLKKPMTPRNQPATRASTNSTASASIPRAPVGHNLRRRDSCRDYLINDTFALTINGHADPMLLASMRSRRTATVSASTVSLTAPIVLAGLGPAIHVFLDA